MSLADPDRRTTPDAGEALLPCPFCGSTKVTSTAVTVSLWEVHCDDCEACMNSWENQPDWRAGKADAEANWNRRATPPTARPAPGPAPTRESPAGWRAWSVSGQAWRLYNFDIPPDEDLIVVEPLYAPGDCPGLAPAVEVMAERLQNIIAVWCDKQPLIETCRDLMALILTGRKRTDPGRDAALSAIHARLSDQAARAALTNSAAEPASGTISDAPERKTSGGEVALAEAVRTAGRALVEAIERARYTHGVPEVLVERAEVLGAAQDAEGGADGWRHHRTPAQVYRGAKIDGLRSALGMVESEDTLADAKGTGSPGRRLIRLIADRLRARIENMECEEQDEPASPASGAAGEASR